MKINKTTLKGIRERVEELLLPLGEELELDFDLANCKYGDGTATFQLKVGELNADGQAITKESQDFKLYATQYGLEPEDLWGVFTSRGVEYQITGLRTRAPRRPIAAKRVSDGAGYIFEQSAVKDVVQADTGMAIV